ncbi:MAG: DUF302 domain-containing protein [Acidimicrobiia bacterium]|nr:DUF302 domain-containing protein [Acidimicrobiia bacterium]MBT8191842.1 DUF302 domain-containing protein [Acidimicrobiia bacterium]MBT8246330.1 DUF302 domain-containing protein [Acidimicrobiia bacterium]NNF89162.1 DUF302 domain-containing protein [Acidimicrobiia bacterium]NNJ46625.1 DUF302 domain-containing protein [Acidimicrobiia bacterium]
MSTKHYGMSVHTSLSLEEAETRIRAALADQGFGILTEIDVAGTLEAKLGIERRPYKILGACNPPLANRALEADESIGLLLPCNVVVYEDEDGTVVSAIEPLMMADLSPGVQDIADEAHAALERALEAIPVD